MISSTNRFFYLKTLGLYLAATLCWPLKAPAAPAKNIVVLSTLSELHVDFMGGLFQFKYKNPEKTIHKAFSNVFKNSGYNLIIRHEATALDATTYLSHPSTLALFWISHGFSTPGGVFGAIPDSQGQEISPVFEKVHSNLRYLSIIGCNVKPLFQQNRSQGLFHPNLKTSSFLGDIDFWQGLTQSLLDSVEVLDASPETYFSRTPCKNDLKFEDNKCPWNWTPPIIGNPDLLNRESTSNTMVSSPNNELFIVINNTNPTKEALLSANGAFIGLLKQGSQLQFFKIPTPSSSQKNHKLNASFFNTPSNLQLNPLTIETLNPHSFIISYMKDRSTNNVTLGSTHLYYLNTQ